MEGPMISVIVPVYNAEKYLRRCLDSLRSQAYHNMEFVLVDDGSSDKSSEICDQYIIKDARFCVHHQENSGAAAARNAGLAVAKGDWIGFVDSDDYVEPDMYAYLLDLAQRHNADIAQCGAIIEENNEKTVCNTAKQESFFKLCEPIPTLVWNYMLNYNCCRLYKSKMLNGVYFDSKYVIGEDVLFNLEAICRSRSIVFGTDAKYHYIQNNESLCHASLTDKSLNSVRSMFLFAEKIYKKHKSIYNFCKESRLRNNLDICSKVVCNRITDQHFELVQIIRLELRELWKDKFKSVNFSKQEKLKCFLIGYGWSIYQFILPKWKNL